MKLSKKLYPKTKRIGDPVVTITEKLDGSNLGIFKLEGDIYVAQRNTIFLVGSEEFNSGDGVYKGLVGWMGEHHDWLKENLNEQSAIWGEWIGMGQIKYGDTLDHRFYMFAKANVHPGFEVSAIIYKEELFHWSFATQEIPSFIGVVPTVLESGNIPSIQALDELYDEYVAATDHPVEGFIIRLGNVIEKYVRLKGGKLQDHIRPR